jgi:release factor glutamine methyltransferase
VQQRVCDLAEKLLSVAQTKDQAVFEAWVLLETVTGKRRVDLLVSAKPLTQQEKEDLARCVQARVVDGCPLAYVVGSVPFAGLTLLVRPPILIPRPETEEMVCWIIENFKDCADKPLKILDMCTGSGCIALALAHAFPAWSFIGVDISAAAIALAQDNKNLIQVGNVKFLQGSLFGELPYKNEIDLIVSNPPYVGKESQHRVGKDVLQWEDHGALFAADEGMAFYRELLAKAPSLLNKNSPLVQKNKPRLVFEIGVDQQDIERFCSARGAREIAVFNDSAGLKRWVGCLV